MNANQDRNGMFVFFKKKMLPFFSLYCKFLDFNICFRSLCYIVFRKVETWGHRICFLEYRAAKTGILDLSRLSSPSQNSSSAQKMKGCSERKPTKVINLHFD